MIDRRKVYYYRVTGEPKYTGLAMDCQMHQRDREDWKELWFFDTIRPHMFEGEIVRETEDGFVFRSDETIPGEWVFKSSLSRTTAAGCISTSVPGRSWRRGFTPRLTSMSGTGKNTASHLNDNGYQAAPVGAALFYARVG